MAIAIALLEFNNLGRSVTPTFLFTKQILFAIISTLFKNEQKINRSMWEVKKISRFLSTGHGILQYCGCKARETMVSKCELIL